MRNDPKLLVLASGKVKPGGREVGQSYAATICPGPKSNLVFNATSCWWSMMRSRPPGAVNPPNTDFSREDSRVQIITKNLMRRMIAGRGD